MCVPTSLLLPWREAVHCIRYRHAPLARLRVSLTEWDTICGTDRCACYLAHRECDPELCLECQAKQTSVITLTSSARAHQNGTCACAPGNRAVHRRGGANNDLIIEYVGELVYDLTTESREPIAEHRGRNYLFELNNTLSIDGMYVGNNARYIDQDTQNPNCCARVCMVNSEHWIVVEVPQSEVVSP
ncbi:hypothetical protein B0H13DRAFT_1866734 [Mycena leptocephala]|nr:hypothetical protein B0H13DRAFT_1866734 [Mycena leptocephala]